MIENLSFIVAAYAITLVSLGAYLWSLRARESGSRRERGR